MKHYLLRNSILFLLGQFFIGLHAQEALTASGNELSGTGGYVSYTLGQVFYQSHFHPEGTVTQGVQQAYEIYSLSQADEVLKINLRIYPNPTEHYLNLEIIDSSIIGLEYILYDIQGKKINQKQITQNQIQIDMLHLVPSTYFLHIIQEQQRSQSFKIIKN